MRLIIMVAALITAQPALAQSVIPLWEKGQPGFEARRDIPEQHAQWWWRSINNPSLTVFAPTADKNTGTAVIILPGGGHRELVFGEEGTKPAQHLQGLGVTAFALKYVLAREDGSPYTIKDAKADAVRAVRYVRAHATEYGIDPNRVGVMGFSAGGELVSMLAFDPPATTPSAADPVDRQPARPDFLIEIYPGPAGIPPRLASAPPPVFMLTAYDDHMAVESTGRIQALYQAWPKVPYERHIVSGDGHGFNMGDRSQRKAVRNWPDRLADWLHDQGYLSK